MKNSKYNLFVVALVVCLVGIVSAAETPIVITSENVDPNTGDLLWSFESGESYVLSNDIISGLAIKDVNDVTIDLNCFKVQGDGSKTTQACNGLDESTCANTSECTVLSYCTGGTSTASCSVVSKEDCGYVDGCSWNSGTSQCEGYVGCYALGVPDCESYGCSPTGAISCDGYKDTIGLTISDSNNANISNGRVQGFAVGIQITGSTGVISRVTSIGSVQGVSAVSTNGNVDINDCVIGTTAGTTSASFVASGNGTIVVRNTIFTGGNVSSNSANVTFDNCIFTPADGSTYTEIVDGESIVKTAGLPVNFVMTDFVAYLNKGGAMMFGTNSCSYCKKQRELFGDAFSGIVEYDCTMTGDAGTDQQKKDTMTQLGVKSFPTWLMPDGKLYPGFKTIPELAKLSGYVPSK